MPLLLFQASLNIDVPKYRLAVFELKSTRSRTQRRKKIIEKIDRKVA